MTTGSAILGIDPGLSGALAIWLPAERILQVVDMPVVERVVAGKQKRQIDMHGLALFLENNRHRLGKGVVEQVNAMPGQGVTSSFGFGKTAGICEMAVVSAGLVLQTVVPQVWKRKFGLLGQPKDASRAAASRLLPQYAYLWPRKKDDGRAEATLLALYGEGK